MQSASRLVVMCLLLVSMAAEVDGLAEVMVHKRVLSSRHLVVVMRMGMTCWEQAGLLALRLHGYEVGHIAAGGAGEQRSLVELVRGNCACTYPWACPAACEHEIVCCVRGCGLNPNGSRCNSAHA